MLGSRGELEHKLEVAGERIRTLKNQLEAAKKEIEELKAPPKAKRTRKPSTKKKK